ncbi:hypothetical protein L249_0637 [Ophiocordyceps polyrhachis-furcata BCC 54312]|uniref:Uncharacterized protein n=1 Tax=Ophiocordyceps polyrhachis-furcata BCC 54312 TaxID=1330021 RepID=A0A367LFX0_9HYPO|nr:hypothetical protein L249_0637 [Ophiocordyceps polyrhachis-furcata BCC 54312]
MSRRLGQATYLYVRIYNLTRREGTRTVDIKKALEYTIQQITEMWPRPKLFIDETEAAPLVRRGRKRKASEGDDDEYEHEHDDDDVTALYDDTIKQKLQQLSSRVEVVGQQKDLESIIASQAREIEQLRKQQSALTTAVKKMAEDLSTRPMAFPEHCSRLRHATNQMWKTSVTWTRPPVFGAGKIGIPDTKNSCDISEVIRLKSL